MTLYLARKPRPLHAPNHSLAVCAVTRLSDTTPTARRNRLSDWLNHNAGIRGYTPDPADSIEFEETVEAVVLETP